MTTTISTTRRGAARLLAVAAALLLARGAEATIDTMFVNHISGPALCGSLATNPEIAYGQLHVAAPPDHRPAGATFKVELDGFGADLATGITEGIAGLSASIVNHGTHNSPSGGTFFGQAAQTGFVTVQIVVGTGAALGNGNVQVNWLTGHEIIPLTIVASCAPTPTPAPHPRAARLPRSRASRAASRRRRPLLPDLVPTDFVNFRTCNRARSARASRTRTTATARSRVSRTFTQPDLQFGVRNISGDAGHDAVRRRPQEEGRDAAGA